VKRYSLVVPVYNNEASVAELVDAVAALDAKLGHALEAVFVVDGSPDRSHERLAAALPGAGFASRLLVLSRNFGSFQAIRAGLAAARGELFAMMSADLQEPPSLVLESLRKLDGGDCDVVLGVRTARDDPLGARIAARLFWGAYRRLVQRDVPPGGVDMFACNRAFRDRLLALDERRTSLVGQVLWLGFRRAEVPYQRQARRHGRSSWTLGKKLAYLSDSLYSFSDLPIRALTLAGVLGLALSALLAVVVLVARMSGEIAVPGYAATVLVILFFASLNAFGLGIIGGYTWRAYENVKRRPGAIVMEAVEFDGSGAPASRVSTRQVEEALS
jgi:glycosyltransferase involved in cell wall biosynthesis